MADLKNSNSKINSMPLIAAGILMGIGMGGFIDGILFHQILQLHSMLSGKLPQDNIINIKVSMVWDGLFHALTWVTIAVAVKLLWEAAKNPDVSWSGRTYWGALLAGWGIFNLVEGIIDHHILGIHHVVELYGLSVYDYLFLASGVLFLITGLIFISLSKKDYEEIIKG